MNDSTFIIGPGNDFFQAFEATLSGHQIRMPQWPADLSWVFERNLRELMAVRGKTVDEWKCTGEYVFPGDQHQLFKDWEVLPKIDHQSPTV